MADEGCPIHEPELAQRNWLNCPRLRSGGTTFLPEYTVLATPTSVVKSLSHQGHEVGWRS